MYFSTSPTSEFARERFKELMEDGQPHSFREITDYVLRQAVERDFCGEFYPSKIWMAITQLTKKEDSLYTRISYGMYQKGGQALRVIMSSKYDLERVLDKAVELEELLHTGFSQEGPLPDMTPEETNNYKAISQSTAAGINEVIEGIAAWLAQMEDHDCALSQEHDQGMSMTR